MRRKYYDKDFEFVLNSKQKNYLINKSNNLAISGAEYIRLLIEQDILKEELANSKKQTFELYQRLFNVKEKLKYKGNNGR